MIEDGIPIGAQSRGVLLPMVYGLAISAKILGQSVGRRGGAAVTEGLAEKTISRALRPDTVPVRMSSSASVRIAGQCFSSRRSVCIARRSQ